MKKDRYQTARQTHSGIIIVILLILLAILIPICVFLAHDYVTEPKEYQPAEESASVDIMPDISSEPSEEPEKESSFEPQPVLGGLVSESVPVTQDYFDNAVFFGDSITSGISVYQVMNNAQVIAATGINPSTVLSKPIIPIPGSEDRMTMIDALNVTHPGKIYVQLGANWVGERSNVSETTFVDHYRALIVQIREKHPESLIYIQSMFPVSRAYDSNENGKNTYGLTNTLIRSYNRALENLAIELNVWYLNVYDELCDEEGYLPDDSTSDGMHLVPEYYQKWFDYLRAHTVPTSESAPDVSEPSTSDMEVSTSSDSNGTPISLADDGTESTAS